MNFWYRSPTPSNRQFEWRRGGLDLSKATRVQRKRYYPAACAKRTQNTREQSDYRFEGIGLRGLAQRTPPIGRRFTCIHSPCYRTTLLGFTFLSDFFDSGSVRGLRIDLLVLRSRTKVRFGRIGSCTGLLRRARCIGWFAVRS